MNGSAFIAILNSSAAIKNKLGDPVRVYPSVLPQDVTYPAGAYRIVSLQPHHSLNNTSELDDYGLDLHLYGQNHADLEDVEATIANEIQALQGTYSGIEVVDVLRMGVADDYLEEIRIFTKTPEYIITTR